MKKKKTGAFSNEEYPHWIYIYVAYIIAYGSQNV